MITHARTHTRTHRGANSIRWQGNTANNIHYGLRANWLCWGRVWWVGERKELTYPRGGWLKEAWIWCGDFYNEVVPSENVSCIFHHLLFAIIQHTELSLYTYKQDKVFILFFYFFLKSARYNIPSFLPVFPFRTFSLFANAVNSKPKTKMAS